MYGRSREAQVPALLEAYNIPFTFSDPLTLALCLDKSMTKKLAREAGIPTPDFFTISLPEELEGNAPPGNMHYPLFLKPLSEGTGKGVTPSSIVESWRELKESCISLLTRYSQPVLVEEYLPGREFTVGILGSAAKARAAGVLEIELLENAEPLVYSFLNKELCEERVLYSLVDDRDVIEEASDLALRAYRLLGCRDAGRVDLKADASGRIQFLEINPLAGMHPSHSDLPILCHKKGIPYPVLISDIIESALERRNSLLTDPSEARLLLSKK